MKGFIKGLAFMVITIMGLALTNPKEYKLREELRAEGVLNIHLIDRQDFVICSLSKVESGGVNGMRTRVYLGILTRNILIPG